MRACPLHTDHRVCPRPDVSGGGFTRCLHPGTALSFPRYSMFSKQTSRAVNSPSNETISRGPVSTRYDSGDRTAERTCGPSTLKTALLAIFGSVFECWRYVSDSKLGHPLFNGAAVNSQERKDVGRHPRGYVGDERGGSEYSYSCRLGPDETQKPTVLVTRRQRSRRPRSCFSDCDVAGANLNISRASVNSIFWRRKPAPNDSPPRQPSTWLFFLLLVFERESVTAGGRLQSDELAVAGARVAQSRS